MKTCRINKASVVWLQLFGEAYYIQPVTGRQMYKFGSTGGQAGRQRNGLLARIIS